MRSNRVTAADIARATGLSRATVGFVLNNTPGQTISEATRQRVLRVAKDLGYHPHPAARTLARGRSNIVVLLLPDWPLGYSLGRNLDEASQALDAHGLTLITQTIRPRTSAHPLWEAVLPDVVMGLLAFPAEEVRRMRAAGVRAVIPDGSDGQFRVDQLTFTDGPAMQVEHLLTRGAQRLVWAQPGDPRLASLAQERYATARRRAEELGHTLETVIVGTDRPMTEPLLVPRAGERVGVAAFDDEMAARVVGSAVRAGIAVPDQLAVIGHDDTPIAALFVPALTTVRIDVSGLGKLMAALAVHSVLGNPMPAVGPEARAQLIVRESS